MGMGRYESVIEKLKALETKWGERSADWVEAAGEEAMTGTKEAERLCIRVANNIDKCINDIRALRVELEEEGCCPVTSASGPSSTVTSGR